MADTPVCKAGMVRPPTDQEHTVIMDPQVVLGHNMGSSETNHPIFPVTASNHTTSMSDVHTFEFEAVLNLLHIYDTIV